MTSRTKRYAQPLAFWREAAMLAGGLANEGMQLTQDPLVWVAALEMAQEALLASGGDEMRADWHRAQAGRCELAARDIVFCIEQSEENEDGA